MMSGSKEALRSRIDIVALIEGDGVALVKRGSTLMGACPLHNDRGPSLAVYPKEQRWRCFGCKAGGDAFDWAAAKHRVDFKGAFALLRQQYGEPEPVETVYRITDADGRLIAEHCRQDYPSGEKKIWWRCEGQNGLGGMPVDHLPLYGLHTLSQRPSDALGAIIIAEGEKAADALIKTGYAGLGTVTGASGCPSREAFEPLAGRQAMIYLWPDNDDVGREHMRKVATHLQALGVQPYIIDWPEAPPKGDAYDFLQTGGDVARLLAEAKPWTATVTGTLSLSGTSAEATVTGVKGNVTIYGYKGERYSPHSPNNRYKSVTDSCCNGSPENPEALQADETVFARVLDWVKGTSGWWSTQELDSHLEFRDTKAKDYRRLILHRLKEQGVVESHPTVNRRWRFVDTRLTRLDFKTASSGGALPLKWPFEIERYVSVFGGNLVVVAGSPNSGKTAFLLNFIRSNMSDFPIAYFSSEMGGSELRSRLEMFPDISINEWNFEAFTRTLDFHDVVKPDFINVIDFLEVSDEFWKIGATLTAIAEKVKTGLAVVALQKKPNAPLGRGDSFSEERARLYLTMDRGKLTIRKGKSWANPKADPNGLSVGFHIVGGCEFHITKPWYNAGFDANSAPPPPDSGVEQLTTGHRKGDSYQYTAAKGAADVMEV